jgi:hemerythrin superfamily protein
MLSLLPNLDPAISRPTAFGISDPGAATGEFAKGEEHVMSRSSEAIEADRRPDDLIAAVLADHAEIKGLFREVTTASATEAKEDAFRRLVRKLVVHETAEQEVVRPLTRRAPDGDRIADGRLQEESEGEKLLAELERLGVDDPSFDAKIEKLRRDVVEHAELEEQHEHPRIEEHTDQADLERLAGVFRLAEKAAPTHPHPRGPQSATGNVAVGPVVGLMDRARDAIRKAMK